MGYNESSDTFISVSLHQNGKATIFALTKNHQKIKEHQKELLQILGYSLALIIHMVLIMQLAVLLYKSLNLI